MELGKINWLAVIVCAIVMQPLGAVWYGALFQFEWMAAVGLTMEDADRAGNLPYVWALLGAFGHAFLLAHLMNATGKTTAAGGIVLAGSIWAFFIFPFSLVHDSFAMFPYRLTFIDTGHTLVGLMIMGLILGAWRPAGE